MAQDGSGRLLCWQALALSVVIELLLKESGQPNACGSGPKIFVAVGAESGTVGVLGAARGNNTKWNASGLRLLFNFPKDAVCLTVSLLHFKPVLGSGLQWKMKIVIPQLRGVYFCPSFKAFC